MGYLNHLVHMLETRGALLSTCEHKLTHALLRAPPPSMLTTQPVRCASRPPPPPRPSPPPETLQPGPPRLVAAVWARR